MAKMLILFVLTGFEAIATAGPSCTVSVNVNGDSSTQQSAPLVIHDASTNPILMQAEVNGVSVAAWYHTDTGAFDTSITATSIVGAYSVGMIPGPDGLTIIDDESPAYEATLKCSK